MSIAGVDWRTKMVMMTRWAKLVVGDWELFPMKRFAKTLLVGYMLLPVGTLLMFFGPRFIAVRLLTSGRSVFF